MKRAGISTGEKEPILMIPNLLNKQMQSKKKKPK